MAERRTKKFIAIMLAAIVVLAAGAYGVVVWRTFESASGKQAHAMRPPGEPTACGYPVIRKSTSTKSAASTAPRPECDTGALRVTVVEGETSAVCVVDPTSSSGVACSRGKGRSDRR